MRYPSSYHAAHRHIVAFGSSRYPSQLRGLIAAALRDLRRCGWSRADQQWERRHFHFCGMPAKK